MLQTMSWTSRLVSGLKAFREAFMTPNIINTYDFNDFESRKVRYDVLASMYDNTTYRDLIHAWAIKYKSDYGLYKAIRNIYNPTNRCVEFWKWMIWGGILDPEAQEQGAIPVQTDNQDLRKAIAAVWQASNWGAYKDIVPQYGTEFGDVAIKIVDDMPRGEVYLEVVHPKTIKDLTLDTKGYVKGYVIQEARFDPDGGGRIVTYTEECTHDFGADAVNYRTFKDNALYAWNGVTAEWSEPYGFVPLVAFQHIRTGDKFGWAEVHPHRTKIHELDDLASKLHDYLRKAIDPVWLFNFKKPKDGIDLRVSQTSPTTSNPQPNREELPAIYVSDANAKAQALVTSEVQIEKGISEIQNLIAELERDLPELQMDIWTAGQYTTGKALRNARQRVERKVIQRRPEYDAGLVRAHQMAVAIGGFRGYADFQGFSLDSYKAGDLAHTIPSGRPIFDTDTTEELDKKKVFWDTVIEADKQGLPLEKVLADLGKSADWIKEFMTQKRQAQAAADKRKQEMFQNNPSPFGQNPNGGNAPAGKPGAKPQGVKPGVGAKQ